MQRDWEEHTSGSVEQGTYVEVLAGILRKEALKVKKEEARQEKIEGATHNEGGPIQGIKIRKLKELQGRSLANANLLKEFEQMDWTPINFEEILNKRRLLTQNQQPVLSTQQAE
jgi:transposase